MILNGRTVKEKYRSILIQQVTEAVVVGKKTPAVAIIQVGNNQASTTYIQHKKQFAETIGMSVVHNLMREDVTTEEVVALVRQYNVDESVHGILVQLPLPEHVDEHSVIDAIVAEKDVDGLTASNVKKLYSGQKGFLPATVRGIITMAQEYQLPFKGKHIVVIGRSLIVGKPLALALLNQNATVTIAHSHTENLPRLCQSADMLMVAIGKKHFITKDFVNEQQVIFDIGINREEEGLYGDVDFVAIEPLVKAISPVPGGVGQLTIVSLFQNVLDAYKATF